STLGEWWAEAGREAGATAVMSAGLRGLDDLAPPFAQRRIFGEQAEIGVQPGLFPGQHQPHQPQRIQPQIGQHIVVADFRGIKLDQLGNILAHLFKRQGHGVFPWSRKRARSWARRVLRLILPTAVVWNPYTKTT